MSRVPTVEQQMNLIKPADDVKKAIFSICATKSPGPDGYGSGFYKATWRIVGPEITAN